MKSREFFIDQDQRINKLSSELHESNLKKIFMKTLTVMPMMLMMPMVMMMMLLMMMPMVMLIVLMMMLMMMVIMVLMVMMMILMQIRLSDQKYYFEIMK